MMDLFGRKAKARAAALETENRAILLQVAQAAERLGLCRSVTVDTQITYNSLHNTLKTYAPDLLPAEWRERQRVISQLRERAMSMQPDVARVINTTANWLEWQ